MVEGREKIGSAKKKAARKLILTAFERSNRDLNTGPLLYGHEYQTRTDIGVCQQPLFMGEKRSIQLSYWNWYTRRDLNPRLSAYGPRYQNRTGFFTAVTDFHFSLAKEGAYSIQLSYWCIYKGKLNICQFQIESHFSL